MTINNQLAELYSNNLSKLARFATKFQTHNLQGPLCIKVDKYLEAPLKLMIVGQETFGWDQSLTVKEQLRTYENFCFGSDIGGTPFWNITRKVEQCFEINPFAIAWSNLNRFDQDVGAPKGEVLDEIIQFDFMLKEEIKLLAPDVLILFTNHKYDARLKQMYDGLIFDKIEGLREGHFARLTHPSLPEITIRAPHPKTIRVMHWENAFVEHIKELAQKPL